MPFFGVELIVQRLHNVFKNLGQVWDNFRRMIFNQHSEGVEENQLEALVVLAVGKMVE